MSDGFVGLCFGLIFGAVFALFSISDSKTAIITRDFHCSKTAIVGVSPERIERCVEYKINGGKP